MGEDRQCAIVPVNSGEQSLSGVIARLRRSYNVLHRGLENVGDNVSFVQAEITDTTNRKIPRILAIFNSCTESCAKIEKTVHRVQTEVSESLQTTVNHGVQRIFQRINWAIVVVILVWLTYAILAILR